MVLVRYSAVMTLAATLAITPLYAGLLGLIFFGLSLRIPRLRMRYRVGLGDGDVPVLRQAVRVHANFAEFVPFILVLMAFVELAGYSAWFIHFLGIVLVMARVLHAYGLSQSPNHSPGRFIGTVLTLFTLMGCSLLLLLKFALSW